MVRVRVVLMEESRVDATHPPTALRYRFIEMQKVVEPLIILDEERNCRLDEEPAGVYAKCESRVVDCYRSMLYD